MNHKYECRKIPYESKHLAKKAIKSMVASGKTSKMKVYKCSLCCGDNWHITSITGMGYTMTIRGNASAI